MLKGAERVRSFLNHSFTNPAPGAAACSPGLKYLSVFFLNLVRLEQKHLSHVFCPERTGISPRPRRIRLSVKGVKRRPGINGEDPELARERRPFMPEAHTLDGRPRRANRGKVLGKPWLS